MSLLHAHLVFLTKYRRAVFTDAMLTFCTRNEANGAIAPLKNPTCVFPAGARIVVDRDAEIEVEGTLGLDRNKVVLTACQVY